MIIIMIIIKIFYLVRLTACTAIQFQSQTDVVVYLER